MKMPLSLATMAAIMAGGGMRGFRAAPRERELRTPVEVRERISAAEAKRERRRKRRIERGY